MLYQRQCRVKSRYNSYIYQCTAVVAQRDPRYLWLRRTTACQLAEPHALLYLAHWYRRSKKVSANVETTILTYLNRCKGYKNDSPRDNKGGVCSDMYVELIFNGSTSFIYEHVEKYANRLASWCTQIQDHGIIPQKYLLKITFLRVRNALLQK